MINGHQGDRKDIVRILSASFANNKSVNYIVKEDKQTIRRIRALMKYSFDVCLAKGLVYLSDDRKACALLTLPEKKMPLLKSFWLDAKLIWKSIGLAGIAKALSREKRIQQTRDRAPMYYLWFIGVDPAFQGQGTGSSLLREIIDQAESDQRNICLETSTEKNLPWYAEFDFNVYSELDFGFKLYFLKRAPGET